MTPVSLSPQAAARVLNNNVFTIDGEGAKVLFQLLRQADPSMSSAWRSIWRESELTP